MTDQTPCEYIRKCVFGFDTQADFARFLGCTQPELSRFERGERPISIGVMERIRQKAREVEKKWDNNWFFEVPASGSCAEPRKQRGREKRSKTHE
jgi:transcriptional regulator with XRE-family HTH domain